MLLRPAKIEQLNYPRVMCDSRAAHVYHDYRSGRGWYHCCGVGVHRCESRDHR